MSFPIEQVRAHFPALSVPHPAGARVYFDAPGGTQVCRPAIERMVAHLHGGTANAGGAFASSIETDALSAAAHAAVADLLGGTEDEIAFGPNMTSLTFAVSRALASGWQEGDELVLTRLDHDANVAPWLLAARDRGVTVRWLDFDPASGRLRLDRLPGLLGPKTRLVALGGASNMLGTLNDVAAAVAMVRAGSDALIYVDAVQSVPHVATDVRALGCDFLACSPYKFFGPHQGVLWADRSVAERVEAYKVRPAGTAGAHRFETGTPSFEGQAGVLGTIDYLEWLGETLSPTPGGTRRDRLVAAMDGCLAYEQVLGERLLQGFATIEGLKLWGPPSMQGRVPTFSFTMASHHPDDIAAYLAREGIFAWSGHFYAVEALRRLGLEDAGGLVRVGLCHYSDAEEVDRLIAALQALPRP
ncbi:cysteine desulfurase-like protein [Sphingomonas jatrophae]|uniref:Cysteine desulfurase family protein, VC1184 subfamily n=1 Tax=Sphingomonas jatrophae TaxID=1166337 RepID=A0A1I6JCR5_9SPHN|nr:cysteine desulfurase-like protein [Sphingomonas jatrophae]SFR76729.1 cysteine desulfurase family protein, VC1184 subfamily [Sphingomonas jatrophae]